MTPLTGVAALVAGVLLAGAALVARHRRRAPVLPPPELAPADGDGEAPRVAVLLPVRDEEHNVLSCLKTLLAADLGEPRGAGPDVVVIDDGSQDATRTLVEERAAALRAAGDARLTLIEAGELPAGWGGKVHALHAGYEHLRSRPAGPPEWILSTDADTRHHSQALSRALEAARRRGLDAVSLAGWQEVQGLAENLLTPPVFALLDALLADWEGAAAGDGPPVANGQFILLREAALARAGGFEAIRAVAIDDVGLVTHLTETGSRCGFFRAPELLRVRMYRGLGPVYRGWRRNLGGLFGPSLPETLAVLAALLLPPALLVAALLLTAWPAALLLWLGGAGASAWLRASGGHRAAWGLLYPLDAVFLAATLARGVTDWRRGRLVSWKGREVDAR